MRAESSLGYMQVTALGTAKSLSVPNGTSMLMLVPEGKSVRWRDDGVAPTATVGMPLAVGAALLYTAAQFEALQVIEVEAGAKLNVTFYRG